jgi:hypothetical protein
VDYSILDRGFKPSKNLENTLDGGRGLLEYTEQRWKGAGAGDSHRMIDEVYDALSSILWAGNVKGFSNDEPIYKLATYMTHHWLSNVHEDQMLDPLQTEIKFDATSPPVIIKNLEFFHALSSAYKQQNTNYETSRHFKHLHHIGITLGNGTYKQLAYLMNVKNSHWVAIVLDFDESCILYGDSLGGEPYDHLNNVLS